ncbi:LicD family protein [Treponema bryantii]|uniref:LicD family protein n=1 Tax=Treponema bryantii TaxID=163 RepID=UPI002B2A4CC5|nr:phosphorylcholine transferase LicD [Treponema bryantii]
MVPLNIELPEHFLEEEEREGYIVTSQMKELWAVQIDLLFQLDKICKKYILRYVADGGTLLGVFRHKGYIPWDDDIDVCMPRSDYEELCKIAPKELKYPYFFQNENTDPGCVFGFSKICNSDTAMVLEVNKNRNFKFNQGINIDIFPQDNVPDDEEEQKKFFEELQILRRKGKIFRNRMHLDNGEKNTIKKIFAFIMEKLKIKNYPYFKFEKACQRYNNKDCKLCGSISFRPERCIGLRHTASFSNIEEKPFEFFTLPCTTDDEWYLTDFYGDWKTPVKGSSLHGGVIIDTDKSYKEFF